MTDYSQFRILVDLPSRQPGLGFAHTAGGLASLIHNSEPQFAIAVFGPWGSGKTTLMNEIRRQLDGESTIAVEFSAWRYEREQHLIVPLLDTIRAALVDWSDRMAPDEDAPPTHLQTAGKAARKTAETVGKVMASVLAGISFKIGMPGALDLSYDANKALAAARANSAPPEQTSDGGGPGHTFARRLSDPELPQSFYHACFTALAETFGEFEQQSDGVRIVVFVDDLDRCLPSGTLEVLESMKLFFDLRGFVFVVGLDRDVVEQCIDVRYSTSDDAGLDEETRVNRQLIRGADYLKKIFQVPFSLAPVSVGLLDDLFYSLQRDAELPAAQVDDLNNVVKPHLRYLFAGMQLNPREVKRFINAYAIQMKVKSGLEADIVLALNTLAFRPDCEQLYTALATYRAEFTGALREYLDQDIADLDDFDVEPADIPDDIRDYLRGPGQRVLEAEMLDVHLDAGEATRSSQGGYLLQVLQTYREFRRLLNEAVNSERASEGQLAWLSAQKTFERLRDEVVRYGDERAGLALQPMQDWLGSSSPTHPWQKLQEALDGKGQPVADELRDAVRAEAHQHVQTVLSLIRGLRRRAQLGTS